MEAMNMGTNADWDTFVLANKASVWGPPIPQQPDAFYAAKFSGGDVRWDWSSAKFLESRWADVPKFSTRECRSVAHPGRSQ